MATKEYLLWSVLAACGGIAKFLAGRLDIDAPLLTTRRFLFLIAANIFVSGFSGLMGSLMVSLISPDPTFQAVSAGVFGFMGAKGIEMLSEKINNKII